MLKIKFVEFSRDDVNESFTSKILYESIIPQMRNELVLDYVVYADYDYVWYALYKMFAIEGVDEYIDAHRKTKELRDTIFVEMFDNDDDFVPDMDSDMLVVYKVICLEYESV